METIDLDQLIANGYVEDPVGEAKWRKPFDTGLMSAAALMIVTGILALVLQSIAVFVVGFLVVGITASCVQGFIFFSRPRSRHTGRPLRKYQNRWVSRQPSTFSETSGEEIVYVCHDSKTYFVFTSRFDSENSSAG